jgi:hypothetical protein
VESPFEPHATTASSPRDPTTTPSRCVFRMSDPPGWSSPAVRDVAKAAPPRGAHPCPVFLGARDAPRIGAQKSPTQAAPTREATVQAGKRAGHVMLTGRSARASHRPHLSEGVTRYTFG